MNRLVPTFCFLLLINAVDCFSKSIIDHADIVIENGHIYDGNGSTPYVADIAVKDKRIVFIGDSRAIKAKQRIDAKGLIVAPGFIDAHSHTGEYMVKPENRLNENTLMQGVTTIVFGADGMYSPKILQQKISLFQTQGIGTNVGFYVGHNGIRKAVMGENQNRAPNKNELSEMKALVHKGMEMGAVGLSTGLMYEPGMFSDTREVIELAKAITPYGGVYDSHVRNPINALISSVEEAIAIGRAAGIATKIAHIKAVCLHNAGKSQELIELLNKARAQGQNVVSDQYPYDGAKTDFLADILMRPKTLENTELRSLLKDPKHRQALRKASENGINGGFSWLKVTGYNCIRVTHSEDYPQYVGKYLSEIAQEKNRDNFDSLTELLLSAKHDIRITLGGISEQDVRKLLVQPWNFIASDGKYINSKSSPRQHPRSTGTFVRVLGRYVRELSLLSLSQAIEKMTSQPADFLGFSDRGRIQVGHIADLTIFDQNRVIDQSNWVQPLTFAKGIQHVLVNGVIVVSKGSISQQAAGLTITRTHKTPALIPPERLGERDNQEIIQ